MLLPKALMSSKLWVFTGFCIVFITGYAVCGENEEIGEPYIQEEATPLTQEDRQKILLAIKAVDPEAYKVITEDDRHGEKHLEGGFYGNAFAAPSLIDGLPQFQIGPDIVKLPTQELQFIIANVLSHYVADSFIKPASHRALTSKEEEKYEAVSKEFKKGKKVSGQLAFEGTFDFVQTRAREYDADRMAIIDFGINIDDAIAAAKRLLKLANEHEIEMPQKETFKMSQPLWKDRIKHLESLRKEVELNKQRRVQRKLINWEQLVKEKRQELGLEKVEAPLITATERAKFLKGIKAIDPTLYDAIVKVDPTGEQHIIRDSEYGSASIVPSFLDGLPKFFVGSGLIDVPWEELLFTIAHEMSHYALGHFFEEYTLSHRELGKEGEEAVHEIGKGRKVAGQLPFKETLKKTRNRIKENECDRMAVIDFGANLDFAISRAKRGAKEEEEHALKAPQKETFQRTHSLWLDRVKYLESLRSEVELNTVHKRQRKPIDWEKLAQEYVQGYKKDTLK